MPIELTITGLGIILVIIGFILLFIALIYFTRGEGDYGGVILIGPIPIVFGSWKFLRRYWWILSIIGVILLIIFLVPLLYSLHSFTSPTVVK